MSKNYITILKIDDTIKVMEVVVTFILEETNNMLK